MGKIGKAILINDYAHHPDQIQGVIKALKNAYPQKKLIAFFEPHQYERVWRLFEQFTTCWQGVDKLILLPIYYVKGRESKAAFRGVDIKKLQKGIAAQEINVESVKNSGNSGTKLKKKAAELASLLF